MNTLVYSIEKTENPAVLYINLTNACTNNCVFCIRTQKDEVCGKNMILENEKITAEDVISQFEMFPQPRAVVFCGYGEPTIKLDVLKEVAKYLKDNYPEIKIRVNTNGHANVIHKRNILPELKGLADSFSVSLNGADEQEYNELSQPNIENAYSAVKEFIKEAAGLGFETTATMVSGFIDGKPDIEKGRKISENLGAKFRIREFITNGY